MSYFEAILLGAVQGIAMFLPISSTAHLIITEMYLGYHFPGLAFEIFLHVGSALAILWYFRREVKELGAGVWAYWRHHSPEALVQVRFVLLIVIATAITGSLGVVLKGTVEPYIRTPGFLAGALVLTGIFLIIIERLYHYGSRTQEHMNLKDAVIVGLGQTLSVLPGVSRSGSTLITALFAGLSRETAVRYSFLLAIPVILGSTVLAVGEFRGGLVSELGTGPLAVSFVASFVFSCIGIFWLINFLQKGRLIYFAAYCFIVALLVSRFLGTVPPQF